jgi:hypothetical protein
MHARTLSLLLLLSAALLFTAGWGGGGSTPSGGEGTGEGGAPAGSGGGSGGEGGTGELPANPGPQIALLMSSGHSPLAPNYLSVGTGPQLQAAIAAAGYTVQTFYFTDDATSYQTFLSRLGSIRDEWIVGVDVPTRVVIVGHSHGCVRSHAALRAVTDCPVELLLDLDGSSVGWTPLSHPSENALIGGAPEGAYALGVQLTCAGQASAGGPHDLEDTVFPSVRKGYEVRSGGVILNPANPLQLIEYDERWNARADGTTTGLTCVFSGTTHTEVAAPGSPTLGAAQAWIVAQLALP